MSPEDYGIYGLITAASYVFIQISGLEIHVIVMRRVVNKTKSTDAERRFYGRFILVSSIIAFTMSYGFAQSFNWDIQIVILSACIITVEYLGTELNRILVAEQKAELSMYSVFTRFAIWSLAFPLLGLMNYLPDVWKLEWVLLSWLGFSTLALLFAAPIFKNYFAQIDTGFSTWMFHNLKHSPKWILIALAPRFLENGIRIVPGFVIDEKSAGQFIFLATLASIGGIGVKTIIEPFFFSQMLNKTIGKSAQNSFGNITRAVLLFSTLISYFGWYLATKIGEKDLGSHSGLILTILIFAFAMTSLAQVEHYRLYANHRDLQIIKASSMTLVIGLPAVVLLTMYAGMAGTAIGAALTAIILFVSKYLYQNNVLE